MFRSVIRCLLLLTVLCVNVHNSMLSAQLDTKISLSSAFGQKWRELLALESSTEEGHEVSFFEQLEYISTNYTGYGKQQFHPQIGEKLISNLDLAAKLFGVESVEYLKLSLGLHNIYRTSHLKTPKSSVYGMKNAG